MSHKLNSAIAVIGIDIGKNSLHVVGQDKRGAIMLRQKWSRGQLETRLANLPPCLIGMEACVGAHHLSRADVFRRHEPSIVPKHPQLMDQDIPHRAWNGERTSCRSARLSA
jgi:transposase